MNFKKALSILAALALLATAGGTVLADETDSSTDDVEIIDDYELSDDDVIIVDDFEIGDDPDAVYDSDAVVEEADGTIEEEEVAEYKQVAENENFIMFADFSSGLFYLQSKSDGSIISSTINADNDELTPGKERLKLESQIYIDYLNDEGFVNSGTFSTLNSNIACVNKGLVTVEEIKNGIRVTYNFETQEIVVPVEYTLTGKGLSAKVIAKDIKEGEQAKLYRVYLLPSFGAALNDQSGYVFIPDGCGALAEFNNGAQNNVYEAKVYGEELSVKKTADFSNTETVRMPVFGISSANGGVFGIIKEGDASASVKATVANADFGINSVCSVLDYRVIDFDYAISAAWQKISIFRYSDLHYSLDNYEVEYNILGSGNNTYIDMAKIYREYLVNEMGVGATADDAVLNLDMYGAFETEGNFLGFKYKKLNALTTYLQATDIAKDFTENGVQNLAVRMIGWQSDGIFNYKMLKSSKLLSVLGGKGDFKEMNTYFNENGINVSYESDLISYRKGSTKQAAATVYNKAAEQYQYCLSNYLPFSIYDIHDSWYNVSLSRIEAVSNKYLDSLNDNVTDVSLSTLMNSIYSDFRKSVQIYRSDYTSIVTKIFEAYKKSGITLSGTEVNAYAFPYVSKIYDAPTSNSGYELFTKEVPFYQIVLHGLIPMTSGIQQQELDTSLEFLKSAETGTQLLYNCIYGDSSIVRYSHDENLYSSTYTLWNDKAVENYNQLKPLLDSVNSAAIVNHSELAVDVTQTVYDNGVTVVTNYSDSDYNMNGNTVSAKSFKIIAGKENAQ